MNLILSGAGMTPLEFKKNKKIDGIHVDICFFLNFLNSIGVIPAPDGIISIVSFFKNICF